MTDSRRKEWSVAFQEIKKGGDENDQKVKTFIAGWLGVCTWDTVQLDIPKPEGKGIEIEKMEG